MPTVASRCLSSLVFAGFTASSVTAFVAAQAPAFSLVVHVHDETLRSPIGLKADDFEVRIDGRARPIRSVGPAGPFSLLLLLDTSASMSGVVGPAALAEAVTGLVAQLRPAEKVRVAAFNTGVEMGPDFGSGPAPISDYLKTLSYRNATRLYDALDTGLATIERQPGRHIILVLSDGSDTDSRKTSADVLTRALRDDVQIWALRPSERLRGVKGKGPDGSFTRIVQDTGGVSVQPQDSVDLVSSLSDVVRYLREQYAIEVDAAAVDRNVHRVAVRIKLPGLTLRGPRAAGLAIPCAECSGTATSGSASASALQAPPLVSPPEVYRPAVPAVAYPSFRDPATGAMITGSGVVGPKAVYSPIARYPQSGLKDRIAGTVFMEAIVDENGRVQDVRVTRSVRADLDDAAVATLKTWRFEAARKDGQAVPAQLTITMSFNVQ